MATVRLGSVVLVLGVLLGGRAWAGCGSEDVLPETSPDYGVLVTLGAEYVREVNLWTPIPYSDDYFRWAKRNLAFYHPESGYQLPTDSQIQCTMAVGNQRMTPMAQLACGEGRILAKNGYPENADRADWISARSKSNPGMTAFVGADLPAFHGAMNSFDFGQASYAIYDKCYKDEAGSPLAIVARINRTLAQTGSVITGNDMFGAGSNVATNAMTALVKGVQSVLTGGGGGQER